MDLECITDEDSEPLMVPVCNAVVGASSEMIFSQRNQAIMFVKDFDKIVIMPLLHNNAIFFDNMPLTKDIMLSRQIDDKFYVADNRGVIRSWSKVTSHILSEENLDDYMCGML